MKTCPPLLLILASLCFACGPAETPGGETRSAPAATKLEFAGRYEVTGVTIDQESGAQRPIRGIVVLNETDGGVRYTSHFELSTLYPGTASVAAELVGTGEGLVVGRRLEGTASTTLVVSSAPGVDTGFAYVPRMVSQRIASSSAAIFQDDGTVSIEIENLPGEGEDDYAPTRTLLVGYPARESRGG
jgi:hypothetical protein